ncbi:MAG TPA: MBL fold metallo-hydrolase [Propionibacteriaceae bacterium]|nr:MBL fold metallo-hydrolase [Propionibacteriaceae bacterium]
MTGLGHVEPGGRPLARRLSATVTLTKVSVGPMDNNAYLLQSAANGSLLIDAANDAPRLLSLLGPEQSLDTVVTTHRHDDHWQALSQVAATTKAALVAGRPDVDAIATGAWVEGVTGVWDSDEVALGREWLEVIGLVGHTPGSIALVYRGAEGGTHVFTGDSLFPGGPGKTSSPADFTLLMDDLEGKIFARFPDDTVVYPGHGDDTTLGAERPQLVEWRARGW